MIELIVMSKHQDILNQFFESIMPTIDDGVNINVLSDELYVPVDERISSFHMKEFRPGKYFNHIYDLVKADADYIGIVNDDILFSDRWLSDIREKFSSSNIDMVSPGFAETEDKETFKTQMEKTKDEVGVYKGYFDAFYLFRADLVEELDGFSEDVIQWYDIDWYLKVIQNNYISRISKKVTVMHLKASTIEYDKVDKLQVRRELLNKFGSKGLRDVRLAHTEARRRFIRE